MATKREILVLNNALNLNFGNMKSTKFAFAVLKNGKNIKKEVKEVESLIAPTSEYVKYETDRLVLAKSLAKKDDAGNPVVKKDANGMEVFDLTDEIDGTAQLKAFMDNNKDVLNNRQAQIDAYNKALTEPAETVLYKISVDDLPVELEMPVVEALAVMLVEHDA
jgi:hypothetical protein